MKKIEKVKMITKILGWWYTSKHIAIKSGFKK